MSPNTTLLQTFTSPQPNSTTTGIIVDIAFGIATTVISAFVICHGHHTWRIWRPKGNRVCDEEHELENVSTTDAETVIPEEHELENVSRTDAGLVIPEEHELGNVSTTDAETIITEQHELENGSTNDAGSHVNDVPPICEPAAPTLSGRWMSHVELTGGGIMDHVELDNGENEGCWP